MIEIVLIGVAMFVGIIASCWGGGHYQVGGAMALFGIGFGIIALFYIYFWVCAFSFYKGLKTGEIASPA